jgi:hypothetical protein
MAKRKFLTLSGLEQRRGEEGIAFWDTVKPQSSDLTEVKGGRITENFR